MFEDFLSKNEVSITKALFFRGYFLFRQGDFQKPIDIFTLLLREEMIPIDKILVLQYIGLCFLHKKDLKNSLDYFEKGYNEAEIANINEKTYFLKSLILQC